jgi:hypothetical protein
MAVYNMDEAGKRKGEMRMATRNQKIFCLGLAAGIVWLRYAKSAEGTRRRLKDAGEKARNTWTTIEDRSRQLDDMLHNLIETGRELTTRVETTIKDTLEKLEQTVTVIHENTTRSSYEISSLIQDVREVVGNLAHRSSHVA